MDVVLIDFVQRLIKLYMASSMEHVIMPLDMLEMIFAQVLSINGYTSEGVPIDFQERVLFSLHERGVDVRIMPQSIHLMGTVVHGIAIFMRYVPDRPGPSLRDIESSYEHSRKVLDSLINPTTD